MNQSLFADGITSLDPFQETENTHFTEEGPTVSPMLDGYLKTMSSASDAIVVYVDPCITFLGIIGNILAVLLFYKNRINHTSLFLGTLAVSDLGQNASFFVYWLYLVIFKQISLTSCKVLIFFFSYFSFCSAWLLTIMTIEKYLAVNFPLHFRQFHTKKCFGKVILTTFTIGILIIFPVLFTVHIGDGSTCNIYVEDTTFNLVYNWVGMSFHFLIPFSVLSTLNILIIVAIKKSRKTVLEFDNDDSSVSHSHAVCSRGLEESANNRSAESLTGLATTPIDFGRMKNGAFETDRKSSVISSIATITKGFNDNDSAEFKNLRSTKHQLKKSQIAKVKEKQMMKMCFVSVFTFMTLLLPFYFRTIFFKFYGITSGKGQVIFKFCLVVTRTLIYGNSAINFYLYLLVSENFRKHLKQLFKPNNK